MTKRVWLVENVDGRECLVGRMPVPDAVILNVIRVPRAALNEWGQLSRKAEVMACFLGVPALLVFLGLICVFAYVVIEPYGYDVFGVISISLTLLYGVILYFSTESFNSRHTARLANFCEKYHIQVDHTKIGTQDNLCNKKYVLWEE